MGTNTESLNDFYAAFNWLRSHPIYKDYFPMCMDIEVVKVDPDTNAIEDDKSRNIATRVWLECGPVNLDDPITIYSHDLDLDCGGETFEKAVCELAKLTYNKYGDYK